MGEGRRISQGEKNIACFRVLDLGDLAWNGKGEKKDKIQRRIERQI